MTYMTAIGLKSIECKNKIIIDFFEKLAVIFQIHADIFAELSEAKVSIRRYQVKLCTSLNL